MGRLDIIKGRIAESIITEMFSEMGYKVVRFGYENIMPELANKHSLIKGRVSDEIRSMPDFVVVDKKNNYAYYLEVKYRENNQFIIDPDYLFNDAFIVLVGSNQMKIQMARKLKEGKPFQYLDKCHYFKNINKSIVCEYVKLLKKFF